MKIILLDMQLTNFKKLTGTWSFDPIKNVFVGKNGTGKTTLYDAEKWLRTGKNSLGKTDFDIKTIVNNQPIKQGSHSVSAMYNINGDRMLKLERCYSEVWTKTRGNLEKEFKGHNTTYRVDGKANTTKRAFEETINEYFGDQQTFNLVSNPAYLPDSEWKVRREILVKMSGKVNTEDIIASIPGFKEMLGERTVEEKTAICTQRKKEINTQLKTLPARIDEQKINIAKVTDNVNLEDAEISVENLKKNKWLIDQKIAEHKSGSNTEDTKELRKLNKQLREATQAFEDEKNKAHKEHIEQKNRLSRINIKIKDENIFIQACIKAIGLSRESWNSTRKEDFAVIPNSCSFCNEVIVCGHCDESDVDGERQFNLNKSEKLKLDVDKGKKLLSDKITAEDRLDALGMELLKMPKLVEPEILSLKENGEIVGLRISINRLNEDKKEIIIPPELLEKLEQLEKDLDKAYESLAMCKANSEAEKRIRELEKIMSECSDEFDQIEKFLFMVDQYNKKLGDATEKPINDMFKHTSFRMFTQQVNGAIIPACDIMNKESKPYETALSAGEKKKIELDIIRTMSKHFDLSAPVFIDGAESITDIPDLDCQVIQLRASELFKCPACKSIYLSPIKECPPCKIEGKNVKPIEYNELTQL